LAEIQNPNQGGGSGGGMGGDSKSLFGFMIVFVLMVVAFQVFGPKKTQQPAPSQQKTQTATNGAAAVPASTNAGGPAAATEGTSPGKAATPGATTIQASSESETVVENELYRITFTSRGAAVKSWVLKKYKDDSQKQPLDLVNQDAAVKFGLPLSLWAYDAGLKNRLNTALYVPSAT
jgi:YidC/Oxa1 family membrane protein insertase